MIDTGIDWIVRLHRDRVTLSIPTFNFKMSRYAWHGVQDIRDAVCELDIDGETMDSIINDIDNIVDRFIGDCSIRARQKGYVISAITGMVIMGVIMWMMT